MNWWMMETAVALLIWAGVFFLLGLGLGAVLWRRFRTRQHAFMDERNDLAARNTALEEKVAALEEARGGVLKEGEGWRGGLDDAAIREFEKVKLRLTSLQRALSTKDEEINALLETVEDREQEAVMLEKGMAILRRRMRLQGLDVELPVEEQQPKPSGMIPRKVDLPVEEKEDEEKEVERVADPPAAEVEVSGKDQVAVAQEITKDPGPIGRDDETFESDPDAETAPVPSRAKLELMTKPRDPKSGDTEKKPVVARVIDPKDADDNELAGAVRAIPLESPEREHARDDARLGRVFTEKPAQPDDLCGIRGIGPKTETRLNSLGVYTYTQIASWSPEVAARFAKKLSFKDRIKKEDWVGQATKLLKK